MRIAASPYANFSASCLARSPQSSTTKRSRSLLMSERVNPASAERSVKEFLKREPVNLEMHLQLLNAQFRRNDLKPLKASVSVPATAFKGSAEDFLRLAQFKDGFGDWKEAHELAYRTLLKNGNNQAVNLGFVGVFLRPGHSTGLEIVPPQVEVNAAIGLRLDDKSSLIFVIEPDPSLRPSAQYVAPDHLVARKLLGQRIGSEIELPSGQKSIHRMD